MPGKSSAYSKKMTNDITMRVLAVLMDNSNPLTIPEICAQDICLSGLTSQKITRSLTRLCEAGLVVKSKSKSKNKMVYINTTVLEEQGYDLNSIVC